MDAGRGPGLPAPAVRDVAAQPRARADRPVPAAPHRPRRTTSRTRSASWSSCATRARSATSACPRSRVDQLEMAQAIAPIATVQNLYNLAHRDAQDLLDFCEQHDIGFIPWFPLATGELSGDDGVLGEAAKEHGATPSQLALAWLLRRSPVMLPIPGTSSVDAPRGQHRRRRASSSPTRSTTPSPLSATDTTPRRSRRSPREPSRRPPPLTPRTPRWSRCEAGALATSLETTAASAHLHPHHLMSGGRAPIGPGSASRIACGARCAAACGVLDPEPLPARSSGARRQAQPRSSARRRRLRGHRSFSWTGEDHRRQSSRHPRRSPDLRFRRAGHVRTAERRRGPPATA